MVRKSVLRLLKVNHVPYQIDSAICSLTIPEANLNTRYLPYCRAKRKSLWSITEFTFCTEYVAFEILKSHPSYVSR